MSSKAYTNLKNKERNQLLLDRTYTANMGPIGLIGILTKMNQSLYNKQPFHDNIHFFINTNTF